MAWRDASNIREVRRCRGRVLDNINDVGSLVGRNQAGRGLSKRDERRGVGGGYAGRWCTVLEWKGVQSISRKSVCTARSPNAAATLSSYSFDRNPLGLCTQSLMALFKDRCRSMTKPSPPPHRNDRARFPFGTPSAKESRFVPFDPSEKSLGKSTRPSDAAQLGESSSV